MLAADLVVAAETAQFLLPEAFLGSPPTSEAYVYPDKYRRWWPRSFF